MSVARIEPGSSALMPGSRLRMLFATSTAFAPACRLTATTAVAEGRSYPRAQKRSFTRSSCTVSVAAATSRR